jgi:glutaredoxin
MTKLTIIHIKDCTCCESVIKISKELEKEMNIELKLQDWNQSENLIEKNKIVSSPAIFINDKFVHAGELSKEELGDLIKKHEPR